MRRTFQRGDIVVIDIDCVNDLEYVPGFPKQITDTTGTIVSTWRLQNTSDAFVTIQLHACPEIPNLQFKVDDIALIVPVELDKRLRAIESALQLTEPK